jgi:hypothetical protein
LSFLNSQSPHQDNGRDYGEPADRPTRDIGGTVGLRLIDHGVAPVVYGSLLIFSFKDKSGLQAEGSPLLGKASDRGANHRGRPAGAFLMLSNRVLTMAEMDGDTGYDCQREAETAMQRAASASGLERMKWVRIAQAWQDLARTDRGYLRRSRASPAPKRRD